ncbi:GNAT family N-acetyltransferase [Candidatus Pacearchaeota archaeon]|nr:GNAT family N-acetyltransferase [Candidatus Pacearchaeota archaeon]
MARKIEKKSYNEWSADIRHQLRSLTLRNNGEMIGVIGCNQFVTTFVMKDLDKVIGWALVDRKKLMIYVRYSERGKGFGTEIVRAAMKSVCGRISVFEHDKRARALYASIRKKTQTKRLVNQW